MAKVLIVEEQEANFTLGTDEQLKDCLSNPQEESFDNLESDPKEGDQVRIQKDEEMSFEI
jgi:hypothetical protein